MGNPESNLQWFHKLAYGVGHVHNELFGAMWFSYLLLFLQYVMQVPETIAGVVFMIGQFCDGILTPLIAHETDRFFWHRYGKRKTMHLIGTIVVSLAFPLVFTRCYGCEDAPLWLLMMYFIPLVCLFQFGYATVQVSHLSLIPEMTSDNRERDELNIIRYAFNVLTDTMVYVIAYLVLAAVNNSAEIGTPLGPDEAYVFRDIAFILVGIGVVFSIIFHVCTPEKIQASQVSHESSVNSMMWKDWFKCGHFYKVSIIYAVSRVITNLLQVYIPLYLQEGTKAPQEFLAIIPLVINMSGFIMSLLVKPVIKVVSKKSMFLCASAITIMSCIWFASDSNDSIRAGNLYVIAVLGGAGGSTMLVLGLSFTADLIGDNTASGGFVYGCMAVTDKLFNGLTILFCQMGKEWFCAECNFYYKNVLCYGVGAFVLVNTITMFLLPSSDFSPKKSSLLNGTTDDEDDALLEKGGSDAKSKYGAVKTGFAIFSRQDMGPLVISPLQTSDKSVCYT